MKRLYERIEDINIKGDIGQLSDVVRTMDRSLQNIADLSEILVSDLAKYSFTNKGTQFEKVIKTAVKLRDKLFDSSMELNDMQNQIVAYQNKIYRYEGMAENAPSPNPYLVTKRHINVETSTVQFNRSDMLHVIASLRNYSQMVTHHIKIINDEKNSIASVWRDTQYNTFASFINNVRKDIFESIRIYDDYITSLDERIKEFD